MINQNIHGNTFSGEKRVKPTDRPPPKKLPSPSGMKTIYASWLFNPMLQCTTNSSNHRCGFGVWGVWELEMKDPSDHEKIRNPFEPSQNGLLKMVPVVLQSFFRDL